MNKTIWVDSEVHLLPPEWCHSDFYPSKAEKTMRRVVYDHPDRNAALSRATAEGLLCEMETTQIDRAVIMGLPWQDPKMCWRNNEYISEVAHQYPERFVGFGVLPPPQVFDPRDSVRRLNEAWGLKGVKVIPSWQGYNLEDPIFEPALEEMVKHNMVLMPHTDHLYLPPGQVDTAYGLYTIAHKYPELKIMAPHLGGLLCLYNLYEPVSKALKNILFITTVPMTMQMVVFAEQAIGAEQLAFGTDFPFNPSHDQLTLQELFNALPLSQEKKRTIAGANVLRFLDN